MISPRTSNDLNFDYQTAFRVASCDSLPKYRSSPSLSTLRQQVFCSLPHARSTHPQPTSARPKLDPKTTVRTRIRGTRRLTGLASKNKGSNQLTLNPPPTTQSTPTLTSGTPIYKQMAARFQTSIKFFRTTANPRQINGFHHRASTDPSHPPAPAGTPAPASPGHPPAPAPSPSAGPDSRPNPRPSATPNDPGSHPRFPDAGRPT